MNQVHAGQLRPTSEATKTSAAAEMQNCDNIPAEITDHALPDLTRITMIAPGSLATTQGYSDKGNPLLPTECYGTVIAP